MTIHFNKFQKVSKPSRIIDGLQQHLTFYNALSWMQFIFMHAKTLHNKHSDWHLIAWHHNYHNPILFKRLLLHGICLWSMWLYAVSPPNIFSVDLNISIANIFITFSEAFDNAKIQAEYAQFFVKKKIKTIRNIWHCIKYIR